MRIWGSLSTLQKGLAVVAVLLVVVLPVDAGLWKDPALVIAPAFVGLFGLIAYVQLIARAAGKLHL